jgi:hypothetical protein
VLRLPAWLAGATPGLVPTLTLAADFPLPAWRQPGRRRRLVRARATRLARAARARHEDQGEGRNRRPGRDHSLFGNGAGPSDDTPSSDGSDAPSAQT